MTKRLISTISAILMIILLISVLPVQAETVATTIKIGDYVQMGKYYDQPIVWRCVDIDEIGPLMLADKILTIKAFDAEGNHKYLDGTDQPDSGGYRTSKGSNLWVSSNIRSWLNSSKSAGNVTWLDGCPPTADKLLSGYNAYAAEKGFLAEGNFTESEQNAIKSVTQKSLLNSIDVGLREGGTAEHIWSEGIAAVVQNYDTAYYHMVTDKMFLLDVKQLNKVYQNRSTFGTDYWIGTPTQKAVDNSDYKNSGLTVGNHWCSWSRSPCADSSNPDSVRDAYPNGDVYDIYASYMTLGVRPAFYINLSSSIFQSGNGSIGTPYVVTATANSSINVIPQKLNVPKNKKWNIKFNSSVNPSDINSNNIYVVDKNSNIISTRVYQDSSDSKVICIEPLNPYIEDALYTLWIKALKNTDGKVMKSNVKMDFTIATGGTGGNIDNFPISYQSYLMTLSQAHPNWKFQLDPVSLKWDDFINLEDYSENNLIETSTPTSYREADPNNKDNWSPPVRQVIEYYADPRNFIGSEKGIMQFAYLGYDFDNATLEDNKYIDGINSILQNTIFFNNAGAIMDAAKQSHVNPYYLAVKLIAEAGTKGNALTNGTVSEYINCFNPYNIGASGSTKDEILHNGAAYASTKGWTTLEKGIIEGAIDFGKKYITIGQDTIYYQKFDLIGPSYGTHQYMQNIAISSLEGNKLYNTYLNEGTLNNELTFKIPVFIDLPTTKSSLPAK